MENIAEAETSIETILREKHDILLEKIEREAGSLGSDCEYSITDDFSDRIIYERRGCHGLENQCHPAEGNRTTGRFRCHRAEVCVSEELSSVSKSNMEAVITKMAQVLDAQGISCFRCPKSVYKLYPLSDACREDYISHIQKGAVRFGMAVSCGEDKPVYTFELTLSPTEKDREGGNRA